LELGCSFDRHPDHVDDACKDSECLSWFSDGTERARAIEFGGVEGNRRAKVHTFEICGPFEANRIEQSIAPEYSAGKDNFSVKTCCRKRGFGRESGSAKRTKLRKVRSNKSSLAA
jgi:hypothetical protein